MPIPTPLRIAFIGAFGHHYLRRAIDDPALDVAEAAACPGHDDAEATRRRFGEQTWFDSLDAMLETFKPNVISVGTMYARQGPFVAAALQRGIPVVADKPIAGSWDDLAAIEAASAKTGTRVITEVTFRSRPHFRAAAEAVKQGHIGDVVLATAQKSYRFGKRPDFYRRRADYGSTLLWVASHGIDVIRFATGIPFASVVAQHGNIAKPDYEQMEDHAAAMYTLVGGAAALVHADLLRPEAAPTHGDDRLRIVGSKGQLEVRDERCTLITNDDPPQDITDSVETKPDHIELLEAAFGDNESIYSHAASLELARTLLTTRDAADTAQRQSIE